MYTRRQFVQAGMGLLGSLLMPVGNSWAMTEKERELTILIWPDYIDPDLLKRFAEEQKIAVRQIAFESDQERDQLMLRKGAAAFDLLVVNRVNLPLYAQRGWVSTIDTSKLGHFSELDKRWLAEPDSAGNVLGIPYFWGNIGLAYRADLLAKAPVSWMDFFRPAESLRGFLNAMESDREMLGMALRALGFSVNSEDPGQLTAAEALLQEQKPFVKYYRYLDLSANSPLVTGEVKMAIVFNGDAVKLREFHPEIRYIHPQEGSAIWVDYLAVGKVSAARQEMALRLIHFLSEPVNALQNAQNLHFATPNQIALQKGSAEYRQDPAIFPPTEVLINSEPIRSFSARTQKRINDFMGRLLR
ncbi:polyamine ABC transporter substrate-binding protein [Candidatus Magnetaquicoccus inordinatus]|uniref:polyamine ABC transporter substrate-binding protein n=1 Tax=Candidatus Magnetaquicoccus inordinatus TaxID=2496818 RepID=UPI00102BCDEE|nr:spermidine/putrescine ABC transporter substrate-binding protein [Candidatus Magnetaquicoccus inordinatus]